MEGPGWISAGLLSYGGGARAPGGHQGQLLSQGGEEGGEELQLLGRAPPGELEGDGGAQEDQSLAGGLRGTGRIGGPPDRKGGIPQTM